MKHAEARTLIATLETALGESSKSWKLDHDRKNEFKMWLQEAKEQIEIDVKAITMPVLRNQPDSRVFVASEFAELSDGLKHIEWAVRIGGIRPAEITNPEELPLIINPDTLSSHSATVAPHGFSKFMVAALLIRIKQCVFRRDLWESEINESLGIYSEGIMRKYAERKAEPLFARLEDTILNRKVFQEWGSRRQVGIMIELRELLKYLGQLRLGTEEDRDEDLEEILAQSERYVKHFHHGSDSKEPVHKEPVPFCPHLAQILLENPPTAVSANL
ncbi:hypothetical protein JCM16303_001458 [Sporobolomyces ruberrimus]